MAGAEGQMANAVRVAVADYFGGSRESAASPFLSFPRRRESSQFSVINHSPCRWISAFAGMTNMEGTSMRAGIGNPDAKHHRMPKYFAPMQAKN
jgi:hypothetical protein